MTAIPDDIMRTVRETYFAAMAEGECEIETMLRTIASILLAERERCAGIADDHTIGGAGVHATREAIAEAIRKGNQ